MSKYTIRTDTGRMLGVEYDLSKIFVRNNRHEDADYTNSSYEDENMLAGTLLGKVSANGKLKKYDPAASDGSQIPVGVLRENCVITAGSTEKLTYCIGGDVVRDKVILQGSAQLDNVVSGRTIADHLQTNTTIILVRSTDNTKSDNY